MGRRGDAGTRRHGDGERRVRIKDKGERNKGKDMKRP
jgi:hypothetical protein